jgi:hypothetical protein
LILDLEDRYDSSESDYIVSTSAPKGILNSLTNFQPYRERGRTISSSTIETVAERRQALILKRALCTCPAGSRVETIASSNESISPRHKCVHIRETSLSFQRNGTSEARCVITTLKVCSSYV